MNCKRNDMAIVVRNVLNDHCGGAHIGMTVTVEQPGIGDFGPYWTLKGRHTCVACGYVISAMLDADLQPIRPPKPPVGEPVWIGVDLGQEQPA